MDASRNRGRTIVGNSLLSPSNEANFPRKSVEDRHGIHRKLIYETREQRRIRAALKKDNREQIDINDCIKRDEADLNYYIKLLAIEVRDHWLFKNVIWSTVLINSVLVFIENWSDYNLSSIITFGLFDYETSEEILEVIYAMSAAVFLLELCVRWFAGFYWEREFFF